MGKNPLSHFISENYDKKLEIDLKRVPYKWVKYLIYTAEYLYCNFYLFSLTALKRHQKMMQH